MCNKKKKSAEFKEAKHRADGGRELNLPFLLPFGKLKDSH